MRKSDSIDDDNSVFVANGELIATNVFRDQPMALKSFMVRKGYRLRTDGEIYDAGAMDIVVPKCNVNCMCSLDLVDDTVNSECVRLYDGDDNSEGMHAGKLSAPITNFALNERICKISVAPKCGLILRSSQDDVLFTCRNYDNKSTNLDDLNIKGAKSADCYRLTGNAIEISEDDVVLDNRTQICATGASERTKCERWRKRNINDAVNVIVMPSKNVDNIPMAQVDDGNVENNVKLKDSMLTQPTSKFVKGFGLPEFVENASESIPVGATIMLFLLCVVLICSLVGYIHRCQNAMKAMSAKVESSEKRATDAEIKRVEEEVGEVGANF